MTRSRLSLAVVLLLGCASTPGPTRELPAQSDPTRWDAEVDFTQLRTDYGERQDFEEVCGWERPLRAMLEEIQARDWPTALALAETWLDSCPVDMDAHYLAAVALTELGREDEARAHIDWYRGLVESVLSTGDGHSPETAWVVISVQEEYSILQALQVKFLEQRMEGGIDAMTVESEGQSQILYFNPEAHFRRLSRDTAGQP